MSTTVFTEPTHWAEFLVSESEGTLSRENATLAIGPAFPSGQILGQIAKGTATSAAKSGNVGNGAMGAVTVGVDSQVGVYDLSIIGAATNAGTFEVHAPDGSFVGTGKVATLFNKGGLSFTLADGATDFSAGDGFTITVAAATNAGQWNPYNPAATDGTEVARGIAYKGCAARTVAGERVTVFVRQCEVQGALLTGLDGAATADLAKNFVIVR